MAPMLTCAGQGGCCDEGSRVGEHLRCYRARTRTPAVLLTVVMRRAGAVLQRYGRRDLLRCVTTVLTRIKRSFRCEGLDQAVEGSLPYQ